MMACSFGVGVTLGGGGKDAELLFLEGKVDCYANIAEAQWRWNT